jgi:hypothetical protein
MPSGAPHGQRVEDAVRPAPRPVVWLVRFGIRDFVHVAPDLVTRSSKETRCDLIMYFVAII